MKKKYTAYKQGWFRPLNPAKYKGNPTEIVYRSSWELKIMSDFDRNPDILQWSSEEVVIPYRSPISGRYHRYFIDFWIKKKDKNGKISEALIEVKPYSQTVEPRPQKQRTPAYIKKVEDWAKNSAKWKAARSLCEEKGWEFHIITEKELFNTK